MKTIHLPLVILAFSLPCTAAMESQEEYSARHKETAAKLAAQQDELQADTSDLILGETSEEVVELMKKCRRAMNDAVDLLEVYHTGGPTLAAQSEVIELIYLAAKAKMSVPGAGSGSQMKPGSQALMDMLRQLLGMEEASLELEEAEEDGNGQGQGEGKEGRQGRGNRPGMGADGKSDMASTQQKGVSSPDMPAENRSVPKSTGVAADDMPSEFRKALEAYNRTLQK